MAKLRPDLFHIRAHFVDVFALKLLLCRKIHQKALAERCAERVHRVYPALRIFFRKLCRRHGANAVSAAQRRGKSKVKHIFAGRKRGFHQRQKFLCVRSCRFCANPRAQLLIELMEPKLPPVEIVRVFLTLYNHANGQNYDAERIHHLLRHIAGRVRND